MTKYNTKRDYGKIIILVSLLTIFLIDSFVGMVYLVYLFVYNYYKNNRHKLLIIVSLIVLMYLFTFTDDRRNWLFLILSILFMLFAKSKKQNIIKILLSGFISFVLLFYILIAYRTNGLLDYSAVYDRLNTNSSALMGIFEIESDFPIVSDDLILLFDNVVIKKKIDYTYGVNFFKPLYSFIPREIWENKPVSISRVFAKKFNYNFYAQGGSEPITIYGELFWNFGILSFLTLTTTHPFDGKGLEEDDWDSEGSEKKEKWELPWIEDNNDDSNKNKAGLRATLTISQELNTFFHKLFEDGKDDKYQRPTLPLWIEALEKGACKTIKCSGCGMSYYDDTFNECPYCQVKKPKRLIVKSFYYKNNQKQQERWSYIKEISDNTKKIELPNYLFKSFDILKVDDIFLEVKFPKKTRVELSFNKTDEDIYFDSTTPMVLFNKRVGLNRLEKGISITTESDITILVEIKIEL